ncbi:hypothetical protein PR048_031539 [Dryococelus australis]|uniref:Ribosomal protein S3 n=1 Tax=Dryococelus australis TaxID=614101 RepID=A0ABQ9G9L8_9NEOP|nr:hypothetical protein PR048_031539 [Dryococelus australis]
MKIKESNVKIFQRRIKASYNFYGTVKQLSSDVSHRKYIWIMLSHTLCLKPAYRRLRVPLRAQITFVPSHLAFLLSFPRALPPSPAFFAFLVLPFLSPPSRVQTILEASKETYTSGAAVRGMRATRARERDRERTRKRQRFKFSRHSFHEMKLRSHPAVTDLIYTVQRHDGNTASLARRGDGALGVRVSVDLVASSLLDLGRASPTWLYFVLQEAEEYPGSRAQAQLQKRCKSLLYSAGNRAGTAAIDEACDLGLDLTQSVNRAGRCRWSTGFLVDLPFPPPLHSGAAPFSPHLTLIGSQDLVETEFSGRRCDVVFREVPCRRKGPGSIPGRAYSDFLTKVNTISAYNRQKTKSKYINRIRLERASQKQSSHTHKTPYDRVERCRERKINIKASESVNSYAEERRAALLERPSAVWWLLLATSSASHTLAPSIRLSAIPATSLTFPSRVFTLISKVLALRWTAFSAEDLMSMGGAGLSIFTRLVKVPPTAVVKNDPWVHTTHTSSLRLRTPANDLDGPLEGRPLSAANLRRLIFTRSTALRVQGQEASERYGRHEHARLVPRRSYEQGVQRFRRSRQPVDFFLASETDKRGSNKGDTATRIKCTIAAKSKALN